MVESTSRFGIPFPSERATNWFSDFESMMAKLDALDFSSFDDRNGVILGGGTVVWNGPSGAATNVVTWTSDLVVVSPTFGQLESLPLPGSPVVIPSGYFMVVDLARGATTAVDLSASLQITSSAPISENTKVLAWHNPADGSLIWATGVVIPDNGSITGGITPDSDAGAVGFLVDARALPIPTPSAGDSGGTAEGTIVVGASECDLRYLKVTMTVPADGAQIRFYSDSARTDEIYLAPSAGDHDFSGGDFIDRIRISLLHTDGVTGLESDSLYYRITNNSGGASTFNIHIALGVL